MKKLKDLIKESWLTGKPTGNYAGKEIEFGKVYTAKDLPPFKTKKDINEADYIFSEDDLSKGSASLPSKLKLYMKKFSDEVGKAKLTKVKKISILYSIIKSLGVTPQELSMYVSKVKREI